MEMTKKKNKEQKKTIAKRTVYLNIPLRSIREKERLYSTILLMEYFKKKDKTTQ